MTLKPFRPRFLTTPEIVATAVVLSMEAREKGARAVLIGGAAMSFYGSPRMTTDVDFAATAPIRRGTPIAPTKGNVIGKSFVEEGVTVDWLVRKDDFKALFEDAIRNAVDVEGAYRVVKPEHLVVLKLQANRPKDREDGIWLLVQERLVDRSRARQLTHKFLGGQFAAERFDRWCAQADWRKKEEQSFDPEGEE